MKTMIKTTIRTLFYASIISCVALLATSCDTDNRTDTMSTSVVINNVTWATRNVGSSGTFVTNIEDCGEYYYTREQAEAACPEGWRLPTDTELASLMNAGRTWTVINGVKGSLFGNASNSIFLPAAGNSSSYGGPWFNRGTEGIYWSGSTRQSTGVYCSYLRFDYYSISLKYYYHPTSPGGYSVRCVAE